MIIKFSLWLTALAMTSAVVAQTVTLKVHHFLPAGSAAQTMLIQPWCDQLAHDSKNKLKCQIYPSMQLGGTPSQLFDQAREGVVDVIWTLPGYTSGRFLLMEVFELPFMMQNPEATSRAVWDYVQQADSAEFKDVKTLAFHVHGDGVFHMSRKPITTMADLKGMKVRTSTRQTNKLLTALGATPVAMPVTAVSEALSKSVIDGALAPYDVVPSVKIQDLAKFHSEVDPREPAIYTATFMLVMNQARYDSLPPDLKKVVDANSGQALSGKAGKAFVAADAIGKQLTLKNSHNVIAADELQRWKVAVQPVTDAWVTEVNARGFNGQQLLATARRLIVKHSVH